MNHFPLTFSIRTFCCAMIFLLLVSPGHSQPKQNEYASAINIAGKQRMLSQKVSKEILLNKLRPSRANNLTNVVDTATQFNQAQLGLIYGSVSLELPKQTDPDLLKKMHYILALWNEYYVALERAVLTKNIDNHLVQLVSQSSDELLADLDSMVSMLQQIAEQKVPNLPSSLSNTINLAGRQRMLSQKMTKECLLIEADLERAENIVKLQASMKMFDTVQRGLMNGDKQLNLQIRPTFELKEQLLRVSNTWQTYTQLLSSCGSDKNAAETTHFLDLVSHQNLMLLRYANGAVELYELLAEKPQ